MRNFDARWRNFWQNLAWYLATIIVLTLLFFFVPIFRLVWWLPWLVAVAWGVALVFQLGQLLAGQDGIAVSEAQLKAYLDQALSYKTQIDSAIKATSGRADRIHLQQLTTQINTWTRAIQELVQRLNTLRQDDIIRRDIKEVPAAIADLEKRLAQERDGAIRAQLERTLANRHKQLASLETLQNTMKRAEIQIESTLSLLGTIYSQILTGQSTSHVADYSRLAVDINEEVRLLQDQLEALREVKLGRE